MTKFARRALLVISLLLAVLALLSSVGVVLFKGTPAWYRASTASAVERERFARTAENKLIEAQNWAAELRADEIRAARALARSTSQSAPRAEGHYGIEFTQAELNALFEKWSKLYRWQEKYAAYMEEPQIVLRDGRLILAARMKDIGAVASFQFHPAIDDHGQLRLDLVRVMAGKLPLPDAVWSAYRDQILQSLQRRLPAWRAGAQIDSGGSANFSATAATLSRLVFAIAGSKPSKPILFLPLIDSGATVPVTVVEVEVTEGKLRLSVEPLTSAERTALLESIRSTSASTDASTP